MFEYAQQLGQEKRSNPKDDVWTILSTIEVEDDDGKPTALNQIELDLFFLLLVVAGSETTRNAISLGLLTLLDHPDQLEALRREPEGIPVAVEEILRWSSPVTCFARRSTRDTEIRGVPIAEGDRITLWYPSANRDEDVFDDPFRFDIRRSPNPHVAFGGGGVAFLPGSQSRSPRDDRPLRGAAGSHAGDRSARPTLLQCARHLQPHHARHAGAARAPGVRPLLVVG